MRILFASAYGSTREYAQELGRRFGIEPEELDCVDAASLAQGTEPVIVLSYTHGPHLPAASFVAEHDFGRRPVAAVAVGMSLVDAARKRDQMKGVLGAKADAVQRFYLPGRLNYSELSGSHHTIMRGVISALRLKPVKSDNDKSMIAGFNKNTDHLDLRALEPIVEWVKGNVEK